MIYLVSSIALVLFILSAIVSALIVRYRNKSYQEYIDKRVDRLHK